MLCVHILQCHKCRTVEMIQQTKVNKLHVSIQYCWGRSRVQKRPEKAGKHVIQSALREISLETLKSDITCHISDWIITCPATMFSGISGPSRSQRPFEMLLTPSVFLYKN